MKKRTLEQRIELIMKYIVAKEVDNKEVMFETSLAISMELMVDKHLEEMADAKNESDLNALENQSPEC